MNRMLLAAQEGMVMKKLVGALRALWRSSGRGCDDRIHEMKSYLLPSPSAPDSDDVGHDDANVRADPESDDSSSDGGNENGGAIVAYSPSPEPVEDVKSDDEVEESQQSVDTLDAPTLALGEPDATQPDPTPPDSDSDDVLEELTPSSQHRDSQVSSGWLGRAYMYENAKARDEAEKRRVDDGIARTVRSIKSDLETALKQDLDGELWSSYEKWSSKALKDYGDHVYGHLACPDAYLHWVRDQKAEDWS